MENVTPKNKKSDSRVKANHSFVDILLLIIGIFVLVFIFLAIMPGTSNYLSSLFSKFFSSPIISTEEGRWLISILVPICTGLLTFSIIRIFGLNDTDTISSRKKQKSKESNAIKRSQFLSKISQRINFAPKQRAIFICSVVLFFVIMLALIFLPIKGLHGKSTLNGNNTVSVIVTLTANDEMTFQNLEKAQEIIDKRVQLLAGKAEYSIEFEGARILITLPLEVFSGMEIETALRTFISRPMRLFILERKGIIIVEKHEIKRDMLDFVEVVDAPSIEPILVKNGIAVDPEQYFLKMTFTHDGTFLVNSVIADGAEKSEDVLFAQDVEEFKTTYSQYELMVLDENRSVIYISAPEIKTRDIYNSLAYSLQNEFLSNAFTFSIKVEPEANWENVDDVENIGQYQKNINDISGDTVLIDFSGSDDVTAGEVIDQASFIKARFDVLEVPYCFGYSFENSKHIIVKTSIERIGPDILALLSTSLFKLRASYHSKYDELILSFDEMTIEQDASGYYYLKLKIADRNIGYMQEESNQLAQQGAKIYLCVDDTVICASDIKKEIEDGIICFDQMPFIIGDEKITENHLFVLKLMREIFYEQRYSVSFKANVKSIVADKKGERVTAFGIPHINEENDEIEKKLLEIVPEAEMYWDQYNPGTLIILLNGDITAGFIKRSLLNVEEIFQKCNLENSSYSTINIQLVPETGNQRCRILFMDDLDSDIMKCIGVCSGDVYESYFDEYLSAAEENEFFILHKFRMFTE